MKVYPGKRGFCCFSCGEAGDVIHFTQKLFSLPFRDAMRKLNDDFALGILMDGKPAQQTAEQKRKMMELREREEQQRREREQAERDYWAKFDRWRALCRQRDLYRPKPLDADLDPLFEEAVRLLPQAEYELEIADGRRRQYGAGNQTDPALHAG
jgi:DNA primase